MAISLPLILSLLAADPKLPFTSPQSDTPEYGHGLTAREADMGWISLFDGQTTFGWKNSKVEDGKLQGGETTTRFGKYALKAEVASGGVIRIGEGREQVDPGTFQKVVTANKPHTIRLGATVQVKSLCIRPLGLEPVFNGKNLEGWKVLPHPRRPKDQQTNWRVENGAIIAEGGPGALQLEGPQFRDFVMQIKVRTREKLINGGVFVRAISDDFMNGYEAQIFNACYQQDPNKPARYSTGAIDDRQLARKLVSRDEKPFVMSIIADGPHLATWVNGVQMTDWTDDREPHENPRQGKREKPGAIQLQAHDPQTKVEFHQIRIRAVPQSK
ncbi:MAG: DUF1080 domain-containing protein [Planctomycetaceae bacterium]|nr:DUF1080 domain-containing protein [Planctomycetaceae bacterium]